jgi:putative peptidoglycan lipid II flippase
MTEKAHVTRAAVVVAAATLLSRILGFVRDMLIAWFFGAGFQSDAFFVAFRIPNFLKRLFAEGSLSMAMVSIFTEIMVKKGRKDAYDFAGSALKLLSVILALASLLGILLTPLIVRLLAPGFLSHPDKLSLTILLTRWMFPYVFFIGMTALCMGVLNALGHFAAPALSPVLLNIAMIGAMLWISPHMNEPIAGLASGVVIGGFLQLALQAPFLIKKGICQAKKVRWRHPGIKKVGLYMLPMVFGAAAYQVNVLVGTFLASFSREGSVSYLYYADRLVQFPLGIFAVALSTAVLPTLSRQAIAGDLTAVKETFDYSLKLVFFTIVPAMTGLVVLREPLVRLLFERGQFNADAASLTASAFLYYGIGIWAFAAVRVVVSVFYAIQDTVTPVKTALASVLANLVLGSLLMIKMGYRGIALSTSIASMINFYLLLRGLTLKLGGLELRSLAVSVAKTVVSSLVMGMAIYLTIEKVCFWKSGSTHDLGCRVLVGILVGIVVYGMSAYGVGHPELGLIHTRLKKGK